MNDRAGNFLRIREETVKHSLTLANVSQTSLGFSEHIEKVYAHQPAVFPHSDPINEATAIASHFYANCYVTPDVHRGTNDAGRVVQVDEFINEVVYHEHLGTRNRLHYLVGEVGSGKTAFINYLISRHAASWPNKNIWFVRLDVETAGEGNAINLQALITKLLHKSLRIFDNFPLLHSDSIADNAKDGIQKTRTDLRDKLDTLLNSTTKTPDVNNLVDICRSYATFCSQVSKFTKRNPVLIIDNLDYIAHLSDRELFNEEGRKKHRIQLDGIRELVHMFFHESETLGHLGASILFVMRSDTYRTVAQSGITSKPEPSFQDERHAFFLKPPPWEEVLKSRNDLLLHSASLKTTIGNQHEFKTFLDFLTRDMQCIGPSNLRLLDHLQPMSNHGLRELMSFLARYGWIHGAGHSESWSVLRRFSDQHPIALMAFMLNGLCRFSQVRSHFPNIYLVNAHEFPHEHTYWLKCLLLRFLIERFKRREATSPEQINAVFTGSNGYHAELVGVCLGSLISANASNLLQPRQLYYPTSSCQIDRLSPTARCLHCVDHIFDRFCYLQLVVDDDRLPIPKPLWDGFAFTESEPDYSYIAQTDQDTFTLIAKETIQLKASRVMSFLKILEISLNFEKHRYAAVFKSLQAQSIKLPDLQQVQRAVASEINSLRRLFNVPTSELMLDANKVTLLSQNLARLYAS